MSEAVFNVLWFCQLKHTRSITSPLIQSGFSFNTSRLSRLSSVIDGIRQAQCLAVAVPAVSCSRSGDRQRANSGRQNGCGSWGRCMRPRRPNADGGEKSNSNSNGRICSNQPKGALHSQYAVRKRKDFRWRLNVAVDDRMSFSSVGGRFHARGSATENARSAIRHSVLGWKRSPLLEARSEERDGMLVTSVSRLVM